MIIRKKRSKKKKNAKKRGVRRRISPSVFLAAGGIIAVIGAVLFLILYRGGEEVTSRAAGVFRMEKVSAIVIRDEIAYTSAEHARVDCLRAEGDMVEEGDALATVYKLGYNDELMQSLLNAREEVYSAQLERIGSTKDQRLEEMNERIEAIKARVAAALQKGTGEDLEALCRELDTELEARMEYLRGKVQETETLRRLYAAVDSRKALIEAWTDPVSATQAGSVSYYFDGYEQAMNAEKLDMLSSDLIERAISMTGSARWKTDDKTRVCRIVNRGRWYIAFNTPENSLARLAEGVTYEVEVIGVGKFTGVAREPFLSGKQMVNVLEFSEDIGLLMELRSVKLNITAAVDGITVKNTAIDVSEGETYLELMLKDSHYRIRVDILCETEDGSVIVRPHDPGDVLSEGVRYWNRKK